MVESMMDEVLECRSLYEEANNAFRMRNSDHYREYVRKKPLTPLLQNLLDEIHTQYTIAEACVRYSCNTCCTCVYQNRDGMDKMAIYKSVIMICIVICVDLAFRI